MMSNNNYQKLFIIASIIESVSLRHIECGGDIRSMPIDGEDNDCLFTLRGETIKAMSIHMDRHVWDASHKLAGELFPCLNKTSIDCRGITSAAQDLKLALVRVLEPEETIKVMKEAKTFDDMLQLAITLD